MTLMKSLMGAAASLALTAGAALAEPALIFDLGGKFDKSFNEAAFGGAQRWAEETGETFREIELQSEAQREQALRRFAEVGANPIVMAGFAFADALGQVAADYPDTKFVIIDMVVDAPNVRSVVFNEHEGSYLVGMMAAQASKSGTVGFIGGMDIPLIAKFSCGYRLGAQSITSDIEFVENYVGSTLNAWNDPSKGLEIAIFQFESGADVIFSAAGGTGLGVFQAAKQQRKFAIGVDSNQNSLRPGAVLSSMVKRVGKAIYHNVVAYQEGLWRAGSVKYGLAGGWIDLARDEHNQAVFSAATSIRINQIKRQIILEQHQDINRLARCDEEL